MDISGCEISGIGVNTSVRFCKGGCMLMAGGGGCVTICVDGGGSEL